MILKSTLIATLCLIVAVSCSEERKKRQTNYGGYGGNYNGAAQYRPAQGAAHYAQQQPAQQVQHYPPKAQQVQHYPPKAQQVYKHGGGAPVEEEKNEGPHPLEQLLENSKFECGSKKDGYYADGDVGCQAFHYCVGGHKHSMMCPAGTVFHQVHLNCVPADQDICSKADKFYFVNDYLHKPLEQRGPNNTVLYHHRYYPDGYAVGDPFVPPQDNQASKQGQQAYQPAAPAHHQGYAQHQPAAPAHHQGYAQQPAHHQGYAHQQPAYQQSAKPKPSAPFTPQEALYGPPRQHAAPKAYHQPQAAPAYQAQPRPAHHQAPQAVNYHAAAAAAPNANYGHSTQSQAQALQAHRAAEAAVLAQHYQAQQVQSKYQQQHQQPAHAQPQAQYAGYGNNGARARYGQY